MKGTCPINYDIDNCSSKEYGLDCTTCCHWDEDKPTFIPINNELGSYMPDVGDVILNNDQRHVVLHRQYHSCYDNIYNLEFVLMPLRQLEDLLLMNNRFELHQLIGFGYKVYCNSSRIPKIEKCEDEPPFEIRAIEMYEVRRKKKKTIEIWE